MSRKTLLSFVGQRDPHATDPLDDGRVNGPLLTVLDSRKFDRVVLFSRPHRQEHCNRTRAVLRERFPKLQTEVHELPLADATLHPEILGALRPVVARIRRAAPNDDYTVSLLSGPPEVHAVWVLLVVAGELPARLLNLRRTVHQGLAGPRVLRELDWSEPLAALNPETLTMLSARRDRWDDAELQGAAAHLPRHFFVRHSLEQAVQLSRHAGPVLIQGEPGTQKQLMAGFVHQLSPLRAGPLVILNCATVPEALFETAVFGEAGDDAIGKLRQADGGTLVLIKVQHAPAEILGRLFRAVAAQHFQIPGSRTGETVRLRLIATTDRDLDAEARAGRFPPELWRLLQAGTIRLPPLRERPGDIALVARDELERLNRTLPREKRFAPAALARLTGHHWPSNISELRRVIEQAVIHAESAVIQPEDLDLDLALNVANVFAQAVPRIREGFSLEDYLRTVKQDLVRSVLRKTGGNQSQAARLLGITPQAVSQHLRRRGR